MKIVISFIIFGVLHSSVGRLFPPFGCECSDFTYFNFQGETVSWIVDKLSNVLTFLFRETNSNFQLVSEIWAILWICSLLTFDVIKQISRLKGSWNGAVSNSSQHHWSKSRFQDFLEKWLKTAIVFDMIW